MNLFEKAVLPHKKSPFRERVFIFIKLLWSYFFLYRKKQKITHANIFFVKIKVFLVDFMSHLNTWKKKRH